MKWFNSRVDQRYDELIESPIYTVDEKAEFYEQK